MKLKSFLTALCLLSLTACSSLVSYISPQTDSGHMCIMQCVYMGRMCNMRCHLRNNQCIWSAHKEAKFQYQSYIFERELRNQSIDKSRTYFCDDYMCQYNCDCLTQFNQCYTKCGGQIIEYKK